jgi:hypothetical protein
MADTLIYNLYFNMLVKMNSLVLTKSAERSR